MNITVVCVGKIKEKFYTDAVAEYMKRLQRYAKMNIIEVKDEKTPEEASDKENLTIVEIEGKRILEKLPKDAYVCALTIDGKRFNSEGMASEIGRLNISGVSHIVFIIGGSLGLSKEVTDRADAHWSFSDLTFPHQLMRVILLEQVYRSFRIMNHEPYHK